MGQTTGQIEAHIEDTRAELGSNFQELEHKVKSVTDWKQHFQTNPITLLGVAFGRGIVLATMLGGRKNKRGHRDSYSPATGSEPLVRTDHPQHRALETWDNIKGALIGVAAARFNDFVGEIIPGFREEFQGTQDKARTIPPRAR